MSLSDRLDKAGGTFLDTPGLELLEGQLAVPGGLISLMTRLPLIGASMSLPESLDRLGLGVDLIWMTPEQMVDEARGAYPGIVAIKRGYFPIGNCMGGSGDPYFYRESDGALVRVPHDAATESSLDETQVELVATSLDAFLQVVALVGPPGERI